MNQNLFASAKPSNITFNNAGGIAYVMPPEHQLAQFAVTGCFNDTYYTKAQAQLEVVLQLCDKLSHEYIAKTAIYARSEGSMKDMPAFLCAYLGVKQSVYFEPVFNQVITNGKMLRNFMQAIRSGVLGRKSFGHKMKRVIQKFLNTSDDYKLINAYVGNAPSLKDIIAMVHPKAPNPSRNAFYQWVLGKEYDFSLLPKQLQEFENWKRIPMTKVPNVPFQMLTAQELTPYGWSNIALNCTWTQLRMNLNTFLRHKVFENPKHLQMLAENLSNRGLILNSKVFPYQLYTTYMHLAPTMPMQIRLALQDALEIATENVPVIKGNVVIGVDVSGSMCSPVTGFRGSASSKIFCKDVAAMFATCIARKNPTAYITPFADSVIPVEINPRDTITTNTDKIRALPSGGTNISSVLERIIAVNYKPDVVIIVSDCESWMDNTRHPHKTRALELWDRIHNNNPEAKLICLDLAPNTTSQVPSGRDDIFNIGGFSDEVFNLIHDIVNGANGVEFFVERIKAISLDLSPTVKV